MADPDFQGFAEAICGEWPVNDVEGSYVFEAALRYGLVKKIEGGFDPDGKGHEDYFAVGLEPGDDYYEFNFNPREPDS